MKDINALKMHFVTQETEHVTWDQWIIISQINNDRIFKTRYKIIMLRE